MVLQSEPHAVGGIQYNYTFNKYGQVESETDYFGMTTNYNYHSEGTPGGNEQTVGGRLLAPGTGGYVKETLRVNDPLGRMQQNIVKMPGGYFHRKNDLT